LSLTKQRLSVGLGEAGAGRVATPLLGLAAARVSDQQELVEGKKLVLESSLLHLILELLEVRDEALGDGLAGGVGLGDLATTTHGHVNAKTGVVLGAYDVHGLENLGAERLGQDLPQRNTVDADVALGRLGDGGNGNGGLLLAEGLDLLEGKLLLVSGHGVRCFFKCG